MKKLLAALLVSACAIPASAATLRYTLNDVTFDDGGTFSGYFDYDTTAYAYSQNPLSGYDLTTSATLNFAGHHFVTGNAGLIISNAYVVGLREGMATPFNSDLNGFDFYALNMVSLASGGTLALDSRYSDEVSNEGLTRRIVSGTISAPVNPDAVPEPAMLGLFGMGAIGLGLSRRRKAA